MKFSFVLSVSVVAGLTAAQFATVTTPEAATISNVGVVLELRDDSSSSPSQKATTTQKSSSSAKATTTSSSTSKKKTTDSDSDSDSKTSSSTAKTTTSSKSSAKTTATTATTTSKNNGGGAGGATSTTATTNTNDNAGASTASQDTGAPTTTSSNLATSSTDSASPSASSSSDNSSSGISAGAAAGIAIGAVAGVAALAGAAFLLWRRRSGGLRGAVVTGSFPPDMGPSPASPGPPSGLGGRHGHDRMTSIADSVAGSGLGIRPSPGPSHSPGVGSYSSASYSAVGIVSPTYPDAEAYPIMRNQQSPGFSGSHALGRMGSTGSEPGMGVAAGTMGAAAGVEAAAVPRQISYTAYRPDRYSRLNQHEGDMELAAAVPSASEGSISPLRDNTSFSDGSGHALPSFMIPGGAHRMNSMSPPPVDRQHHQIPSIQIQSASPRTSKGPSELMGSSTSERVELPG